MKCSLGISNFLEEISRLSYSIVFLYFFALITEEDFLILCILPFGNEECHDVASSQKHNYIPEPSLPYKNVKPIVVVFVQ